MINIDIDFNYSVAIAQELVRAGLLDQAIYTCDYGYAQVMWLDPFFMCLGSGCIRP